MADDDFSGSLYTIIRDPLADDPVMIVCLDGWVDAGVGAQAAIATLLESTSTELVATIEADHFIDQRARRPVARIVNGIIDDLTWPEIELRAGYDLGGQDVFFLTGPEPDFNWRTFVELVVELALRFNCRMVIGLGAFPAPTPHTRATKLAATAPRESRSLIEQVGSVQGSIEIPAGVMTAIELGLGDENIPTVTLWARVPHYVAAMAFPEASAALIDGLMDVAGLAFDTSSLRQAADSARRQIDELISSNPEHLAMVHGLESSFDELEGNPLGIDDLPTGDELAAELEQFLRGQDGGS